MDTVATQRTRAVSGMLARVRAIAGDAGKCSSPARNYSIFVPESFTARV